MHSAYKILLGPVLLAQGRRVRRTALRLPEADGARSGTEGNTSTRPVRLLFIGDSSAAGVGVEQQRDALAKPAASLLAERIGATVTWQLIARTGVNVAEATTLAERAAPGPADIVVTALGVNDVSSQQPPARFLRNYQHLIELLLSRTQAKHALLCGVPPMHRFRALPQPLRWYLGRCARTLDQELRQWCAQESALHYVSADWTAAADSMADDGYHPGPAQYRHWAETIADHLAPLAISLEN